MGNKLWLLWIILGALVLTLILMSIFRRQNCEGGVCEAEINEPVVEQTSSTIQTQPTQNTGTQRTIFNIVP